MANLSEKSISTVPFYKSQLTLWDDAIARAPDCKSHDMTTSITVPVILKSGKEINLTCVTEWDDFRSITTLLDGMRKGCTIELCGSQDLSKLFIISGGRNMPCLQDEPETNSLLNESENKPLLK